ncbi:MAG: guanylate kinase [Rikenellaceae bacterium]|nr:guanylate kinase [Rikenellaceae bacterium]
MDYGKVIIFSAPSGAGKSTIINSVLRTFPDLAFSVSATCRAPRGAEEHGREYYFLTQEEFKQRVDRGEFVEWEEVYTGISYGTLKSELDRLWSMNKTIIFDIDVKGALNLKKLFGDDALALFIMPPSVEELGRRLRSRGTDSEETIRKRLGKAEQEIAFADEFDCIIVNDNLENTVKITEEIINSFLHR